MTDFEYEKCKTILDYYKGTHEYAAYLLDKFNNPNNKNITSILEKENIFASLVGFIINILLSVKEDIIENKGNLVYESKLLEDELEKSVSLISKQTDKGYLINNYLVKDAPSVVQLIRNKLAHGNFTLDLTHGRIILNVDNEKVLLRIEDLANFVYVALVKFNEQINGNKYTRRLLINDKVDTKRKKLVTNKKELIRIMSNMKELKVTLETKNGYKMDVVARNTLDDAIRLFNIRPTLKVFDILSKQLSPNYKVTYEVHKIKDFGFEEFATSFLSMVRPDTSYYDELYALEEKMTKILNGRPKNSHLISNQNNITHLNAIKVTNSIDFITLQKYFNKLSPSAVFSTEEFSSCLISMFNSLFSYALDDIYESKNILNDGIITGLDFSKLDFSELSINTLDPAPRELKNILEIRKSRIKKIEEINKNIKKSEQQITNLKQRGLTEKIDSLKERINNNLEVISLLNEEVNNYNIKLNIFKDNYTFFVNEAIVNGIRNSIAHGHYTFSLTENFDTSKIYFKDIYEGTITFSCEVKIGDFLTTLVNNEQVGTDYINSVLSNKKMR